MRIASDAYVVGLMTGKAGIVHCHMGDGARGLAMLETAIETCEIPARVFNPSHVNRDKSLWEQVIKLAWTDCISALRPFPMGMSSPEFLPQMLI